MFFTILIFVLVLSLLVFAHELGHFWTARKLGVKAEEFGFGFPPRAFGFYKNKLGKWQRVRGNKKIEDLVASGDDKLIPQDTVYSVNWIPLGGFVKIKGENGDDAKETDSFASHPIWQRFIILAAGVFMNIVLAFILISIGFGIGLPQTTDSIKSGAKVSEAKVQVLSVVPGSPAEKANLKAGDTIITIDNQSVTTEDEVQNLIGVKAGQEVSLKIKQLDQEKTITITPEFNQELNKGIMGVTIAATALVRYPWYVAIWEGAKTTVFMLWAIIVAFYDLIKNLIVGQPMAAEVAGPIGIANLTGQVARMGFIYLLQFTALLSLNLAVLNFLPFPALDGGRVIFLLIEKIKGKPVKREVEAVFHNIGFILLMILVLWVTFKDILNVFK